MQLDRQPAVPWNAMAVANVLKCTICGTRLTADQIECQWEYRRLWQFDLVVGAAILSLATVFWTRSVGFITSLLLVLFRQMMLWFYHAGWQDARRDLLVAFISCGIPVSTLLTDYHWASEEASLMWLVAILSISNLGASVLRALMPHCDGTKPDPLLVWRATEQELRR